MSDPAHGVLLTVAYDGGSFHGFALQTNAHSVAGELLGAVQSLDPTVGSLRVVSRTDAGVHARGQLVAFDAARFISPRGWVLGLSARLPDTVAARSAIAVPAGFDPRHYAAAKWYRYTLLLDCRRDPFIDTRAWRISWPLDFERARAAARLAVGTHDFAAFRSAADIRTTTVRTLRAIDIAVDGQDPRLVHIDVRGDRFLHNMVRIIVGTLVDVARGRLGPHVIADALASGDRRVLGVTAPSCGLCLQQVRISFPLDPEAMWPPGGEPSAIGADRSLSSLHTPPGGGPTSETK